MTPKQGYHLAILSSAPINDAQNRIIPALAMYKGQLLIELATKIEQEDAAEKAKAEAEKAAPENGAVVSEDR